MSELRSHRLLLHLPSASPSLSPSLTSGNPGRTALKRARRTSAGRTTRDSSRRWKTKKTSDADGRKQRAQARGEGGARAGEACASGSSSCVAEVAKRCASAGMQSAAVGRWKLHGAPSKERRERPERTRLAQRCRRMPCAIEAADSMRNGLARTAHSARSGWRESAQARIAGRRSGADRPAAVRSHTTGAEREEGAEC